MIVISNRDTNREKNKTMFHIQCFLGGLQIFECLRHASRDARGNQPS